MSFGGQTPTIVVLREGQLGRLLLEMVVLMLCRNGSVTGARADTVEHQRMSCRAVDYQEHFGPVWRRFIARGREWQADNHK
jgi:hypothetical protein